MTDRNSSIDFLTHCFPSLYSFLSTHYSQLLDAIFPISVSNLCPTPRLFGFRWPGLAAPCILGIILALGSLFLKAHSHRGKHLKRSLLWFGVMNLSAFLAHSVYPAGSRIWRVAYAVDMAATSTSSLHLFLAARNEFKHSIIYTLYPIAAYTLMEIDFLLPGGFWIPEALYLGVTVVASVSTMTRLITNDFNSFMVLFGGYMFVLSPFFDKHLCSLVENPFGNLLTPAFFGCSFAFFGIFGWLAEDEERATKVKGRRKAKRN